MGFAARRAALFQQGPAFADRVFQAAALINVPVQFVQRTVDIVRPRSSKPDSTGVR